MGLGPSFHVAAVDHLDGSKERWKYLDPSLSAQQLPWFLECPHAVRVIAITSSSDIKCCPYCSPPIEWLGEQDSKGVAIAWRSLLAGAKIQSKRYPIDGETGFSARVAGKRNGILEEQE